MSLYKRAVKLAATDPEAAYDLLLGKTATAMRLTTKMPWSVVFLLYTGGIIDDIVAALPPRFSADGVQPQDVEGASPIKIVTLRGYTTSDFAMTTTISATQIRQGAVIEFRVAVNVQGNDQKEIKVPLPATAIPRRAVTKILGYLSGF